MRSIILLSKKNSSINSSIFKEETPYTVSQNPEDIFYDPAKLLKECGLENILHEPPFEHIRAIATVWEFYLLRYLDISPRKYNPLIKPIPIGKSPIQSFARKVGNPYRKWQQNYPRIMDNDELRLKALPFARKLVSRGCPIRQNGTRTFISKRKSAAKAFFKYLLGGKITRKLLLELQQNDFISILIFLIKNNSKNDLFVAVGLMVSLYGGKHVNSVDIELARAVAINLEEKSGNTIKQVCKVLNSKTGEVFFPPYKNIYDVNGGNRDKVLINFRVSTWIKLMKDTHNASK